MTEEIINIEDRKKRYGRVSKEERKIERSREKERNDEIKVRERCKKKKKLIDVRSDRENIKLSSKERNKTKN